MESKNALPCWKSCFFPFLLCSGAWIIMCSGIKSHNPCVILSDPASSAKFNDMKPFCKALLGLGIFLMIGREGVAQAGNKSSLDSIISHMADHNVYEMS